MKITSALHFKGNHILPYWATAFTSASITFVTGENMIKICSTIVLPEAISVTRPKTKPIAANLPVNAVKKKVRR